MVHVRVGCFEYNSGSKGAIIKNEKQFKNERRRQEYINARRRRQVEAI